MATNLETLQLILLILSPEKKLISYIPLLADWCFRVDHDFPLLPAVTQSEVSNLYKK